MSTLMAIKPQPINIKTKNKDYYLSYDLNAFAHIEQVLGSLSKAFDLLEKGDLAIIKTFLWAGLLHKNPKTPVKEIEKMAKEDGIIKAIYEAVNSSISKEYNFIEEWDWTLFYYIGTVVLNMREEDFWKATPNKLIALVKVLGEVKGSELKQSKLTNNDALKAFIGW